MTKETVTKFEMLIEFIAHSLHPSLTVNQWEQIFDASADLELDPKHLTKFETNNLKA